jgi:NitT/TauT family transport system permease protein
MSAVRLTTRGSRARSVLSVVILLAVWQALSGVLRTRWGVPSPLDIGETFVLLTKDGSLPGHIAASLTRILGGFVIGSALAIVLGLLMGTSLFVRRFVEPYVHFLRHVPPIALISVALILFGLGENSKRFLIAYTTTFVVMLSTMAGVMSIPQNRIRPALCFGASRVQIFFRVVLPSTVSFIYTGMRIGLGNSFATVVVAEMLAAQSGLGFLIFYSYQILAIDRVLVGIIVLGVLGYVADRLFEWLEGHYGARFRPLGY